MITKNVNTLSGCYLIRCGQLCCMRDRILYHGFQFMNDFFTRLHEVDHTYKNGFLKA